MPRNQPNAATDTPAAVKLRRRRRLIIILFIMVLPGLCRYWLPLTGSCFPAGPFLPQPEEENVDRNADDREDQDDREELRHPDQRGIIGEPVAEPLGAADHL